MTQNKLGNEPKVVRGRPPAHGAQSVNMRTKFSDLRTTEGQALKNAIDGLREHFGGPEAATPPMSLIIDTI